MSNKTSFIASFIAKEGNKFFYRRDMPSQFIQAIKKNIASINLPLNVTTRNAAETLTKKLDENIENVIKLIADKSPEVQQILVLSSLTVMGIIPPIKKILSPNPSHPSFKNPCSCCNKPMALHNTFNSTHWFAKFTCGCVICGDMASPEALVVKACPRENENSTGNTKTEALTTAPITESCKESSYVVVLTVRDDLNDFQLKTGTKIINHITHKDAVSFFFDECEKNKPNWAVLIKIETKQIIASYKLEPVKETF